MTFHAEAFDVVPRRHPLDDHIKQATHGNWYSRGDLSGLNSSRQFQTGANRDTDTGKLDYEAYLSSHVIHRFAKYMQEHSKLANGETRPGDNWQNGFPRDVIMKSAWRHFMDWWMAHRYGDNEEYLEEVLCAVMFNVMAYLHEVLERRRA